MPKAAERNNQSFHDFLNYVEKTDLCHIELEKNGVKFVLKRDPDCLVLPQSETQAAAEAAKPERSNIFHVKSPIVGRFYRSNERNRPPLVVEGSKVAAGSKVAIVEAMKIKKEVLSPYAGKVKRVLVRDEDPVEYGQDLIEIEHIEEPE